MIKGTATIRQRGRSAPPPSKRLSRPAHWGVWQHMPHVVGHPSAPPGLIDAWMNDAYTVQFYQQTGAWGDVLHLMIRRNDAQPVHSWSDFQIIKDDLVGPERTAIEVYPPAAELVDDANIYHLWVLPEGMRLPFGLGRNRG